ncbi:MAG: hypothetical protein ACRDPT_06650 [Streptomycetales bacterium]
MGLRRADLRELRSVYYRRPTDWGFHDDLPAEVREWASGQARFGVGGVLRSLPCLWVNHPTRIAAADYKPVQLQVAAECGLHVPPTLVTNDPQRVGVFAGHVGGRIITKPLMGKITDGDGELAGFLYTHLVSEDRLADPGIAGTAHLFQQWVDKAYEIRLTVVGNRMFAAEIHAVSEAGRVDWRADGDVQYAPTETPAAIQAAVRRLVDRLGLAFAALDFIVTPTGAWVFLEANPNGQWGFVELATGQPISERSQSFCRKDTRVDRGDHQRHPASRRVEGEDGRRPGRKR